MGLHISPLEIALFYIVYLVVNYGGYFCILVGVLGLLYWKFAHKSKIIRNIFLITLPVGILLLLNLVRVSYQEKQWERQNIKESYSSLEFNPYITSRTLPTGYLLNQAVVVNKLNEDPTHIKISYNKGDDLVILSQYKSDTINTPGICEIVRWGKKDEVKCKLVFTTPKGHIVYMEDDNIYPPYYIVKNDGVLFEWQVARGKDFQQIDITEMLDAARLIPNNNIRNVFQIGS